MTCREQILSEDSRDFLVSRIQENLFNDRFTGETCIQETELFYRCIYVDKEYGDPIQLDKYPYNSVPKCYTLLDTQAMEQSGILQVQNYPTLQLQGSGVLIGIVDTGIDYQNPIFRNLDGSTRIVGLWDQTIQEGAPPEGLMYGTEYGEETINEALRSGNPLAIVPSVDTSSHGTFMASLAAGGVNEEEQFIGAAPDSLIAVVKLKQAKQYLKDFYLIGTDAPCYQENDIILGVTYLNRLANRMNLPLVVCVGLGTNQGSHSGNSPLSSVLDVLGNIANRAVVIGGGNEANQRHHYLGEIKDKTESKQVEIRVPEETSGFSLELWSNPLNLLAVSIVSPSGEQTYRFPVRSERTESYVFLLEGTVVTVDYKVFVERLDAELVFMRFQNPTEGIWKILVETIRAEEGVFHMWLPMTEFLNREVYFLESNPDYTITEPGSTLSGITTAFYNGKNNSIAIQSGRGYTRSERIKPDLAAPGVDVLGAGVRNQFVTRSGSSIATGIMTGAAALIMEWVVYRLQQKTIDSSQVRNLLVLGTDKRLNEVYPNREWGYGSLDVYNTFETIRQI